MEILSFSLSERSHWHNFWLLYVHGSITKFWKEHENGFFGREVSDILIARAILLAHSSLFAILIPGDLSDMETELSQWIILMPNSLLQTLLFMPQSRKGQNHRTLCLCERKTVSNLKDFGIPILGYFSLLVKLKTLIPNAFFIEVSYN